MKYEEFPIEKKSWWRREKDDDLLNPPPRSERKFSRRDEAYLNLKTGIDSRSEDTKRRRQEKRKKVKQDVVDTLWGIGGCLFFIALGIGSFLFFTKVLPSFFGQ